MANAKDETIRLNNRISSLKKEVDFYKRNYDNTYKKLQEELNKAPHDINCFCISGQNIKTKIDEIISITYKDSFGIEKTIQSDSQEEPLNIILFKNPNPESYKR